MNKKVRKGISIGTKLYSVLGILIISFVVYSVLAALGLNQAKNVIGELSESYMEMQMHNETVSKNVAEIRLYSNLIIMLPDEASATQMAGMVPDFIEKIDVSLDAMHAEAEKLDENHRSGAPVRHADRRRGPGRSRGEAGGYDAG